MFDTRWRKALRDLWLNKARAALVILAMAVGVLGIGVVTDAYGILGRELNANYMRTNPASAILRVAAADSTLASSVRTLPGVADCERRGEVGARVQIGPDEWREMRLFVIDDLNAVRVSAFEPERGDYPAATGEILIERVALPVAKASIGADLTVKLPGGTAQTLRVAGTVHAPGLAPAWMEGLVYGFVSPDTLRLLGAEPNLDQLMITVTDNALDVGHIANVSRSVQDWLAQNGHAVSQIEIPKPGQHPHASQMATLLFLLQAFGLLALILSGVLVANMISSLLAQQIRQIGVMKAIGADARQVGGLYLGMVVALGLVALAVGIPLGVLAGRGYASFAATMLNFDLFSTRIPWTAFALQIAIGLAVPVLVAIYPVARGSRITVREAISDYDVGQESARSAGAGPRWLQRLPRPLLLSLRNTFRRRGRLLLTLATLAVGGACFMVAMNVTASMDSTVAGKFAATGYDIQLHLNRPYPITAIEQAVGAVPGIADVEAWGRATALTVGADGTGGHALTIYAPPAETRLLTAMPVIAGRWLVPDDGNTLVVNQMLLASQPNLTVGREVSLRLNGHDSTWRVVGVVREIMAPPAAYAVGESLAQATDQPGLAQIATVALTNRDTTAVAAAARALERGVTAAGIDIAATAELADVRKQVEDHLKILAVFLMLMSFLVVIVGGLGLASTMSLNVLERTRELGVMRAIGARVQDILGIVVTEGLIMGALSWLIGGALSWPISVWISRNFGMTFFYAPLEFAFSRLGFALALLLIGGIAAVASLSPAWQAAQLTVRETLSYE